MGKTSLALQIATHNGARERKRTMVISLEMSAAALARRAISEISRVSTVTMRDPKRTMRDADWPRLSNAYGALSIDTLTVCDRPGLTVREMSAHAKRWKAKGGLALVVVDYLQLIRPAYRSGSREQDVAEISRSLKAAAKETGVPWLVLAQLNRENEKRADKRPILSDLRESGSIEQDADVVTFVHRESYYSAHAPPNEATFIVAKQRSGPTGSVTVGWDENSTRFYGKAA